MRRSEGQLFVFARSRYAVAGHRQRSRLWRFSYRTAGLLKRKSGAQYNGDRGVFNVFLSSVWSKESSLRASLLANS
jgi:hypothetical protein